MSKAFDHVWHDGLIHKLRAAGITGHLLKWLVSYLEIEDSELSFLVNSLNGITFQLGYRKASFLALFYFYSI